MFHSPNWIVDVKDANDEIDKMKKFLATPAFTGARRDSAVHELSEVITTSNLSNIGKKIDEYLLIKV